MASSPSRTARSPIPCATCVSRSRITRPWAARSRSRRTSCSSRSTASPTASTSATAGCRRCGCARSRSPGRRSIERRARLMTRELIAVVDLGAQYAQLIARRVRECRVYCEVLPYATTWDDLASRNVKGVILSGGPASVYEPGAPRVDPRLIDGRIPVLGICYGMQLMAYELGGEVVGEGSREYGPAMV